MNAARLVGLLSGGFHALFEWDARLFTLGDRGVNEQSITFRLGIYLHTLFEGYHVDCEYNKAGEKPKASARANKQSMKPDIIIHCRESPELNLFCLEAKKEYLWNDENTGYEDMKAKLIGLTHPDDIYKYKLGLAWKIPECNDPAKHEAFWFINGEMRLQTTLADFETPVIKLFQKHHG
jgi:hypothetical protein